MCYEFDGLFRRSKVTERLQRKIDALRTLRKPPRGDAPAQPPAPEPAPAQKAKDPVTV
jgi:hypothetical protein